MTSPCGTARILRKPGPRARYCNGRPGRGIAPFPRRKIRRSPSDSRNNPGIAGCLVYQTAVNPKTSMRAILFALVPILSAQASDWPRWRGPDANGISAESEWKPQSLTGAVKAKWRTNLGLGVCSVSIAGKRLYTLGNVGGSDNVYCMDAETGKLIWRFPYPCPAGNFYGPRATPTLDGGLLYTLSRKGDALCLDAENGKVKWAKDLMREFKAQPTDYG